MSDSRSTTSMAARRFFSAIPTRILLTGFALASFACQRDADSRATRPASTVSAQLPSARPAASLAATADGAGSAETPVLVLGRKTGYAQLADKRIIRTRSQECPVGVPRADAACRATRGGCVADKECVAKANGYCTNPGDGMGCRCQYGCKTDADCGKDEVCLCGEPAGTCVATTCADSSCAPPSRCSTYHNGCFYVPFACLERIGSTACSF